MYETVCFLRECSVTVPSVTKQHQQKKNFDSNILRRIIYSKIPILRPPLGLSKSGLKDHFWTVPKVVSNQMYTGCRK